MSTERCGLYRVMVSTVVSTERWSLDRSLEVIKAGFTVLWCTTNCALVQLAHDQVVSIERWSLYREVVSLQESEVVKAGFTVLWCNWDTTK